MIEDDSVAASIMSAGARSQRHACPAGATQGFTLEQRNASQGTHRGRYGRSAEGAQTDARRRNSGSGMTGTRAASAAPSESRASTICLTFHSLRSRGGSIGRRPGAGIAQVSFARDTVWMYSMFG